MAALKRQRVTDGCCWAHTAGGARCAAAVPRGAVPYCRRHLSAGDGALRAARHPNAVLGSVLVARRALPAGYRLAFWGDRTRAPYIADDDRTLQYLSGPKRKNPNGVIDPAPYQGSLGQFMSASCACACFRRRRPATAAAAAAAAAPAQPPPRRWFAACPRYDEPDHLGCIG